MRGLMRFLAGLDTTTIIFTLSSCVFIVIIAAGQFFPSVYSAIVANHVFEILVIVALLELIWAGRVRKNKSAITILSGFEAEHTSEAWIDDLIAGGRVSSVKILGASL